MIKSLFAIISCSFLLNIAHADMLKLSGKTGEEPQVLIELFTSQGCHSCPPADKWLGGLDSSRYADKVVPLALHVDYWDYIGWKDRFAQAKFTDRQRKYAQLKRSNTVYTPQIMLNGKDMRLYSDFETAIDQAAKQMQTLARFSVDAEKNAQTLAVQINIEQANDLPKDAQIMLAITEDELSTDIKRGENAGKTLDYSHVTRVLKKLGSPKSHIETNLTLSPDWHLNNLSLVVFIQTKKGQMLQALRLPFAKGSTNQAPNT